MKKWTVVCVSVLALALVAQYLVAADAEEGGRARVREGKGPREGGRPRPGGEGGEGAEGGGHRRPPASPLLRLLDADRDGALSAEEIANASKALLKLDKDGDGALSREELRPPRPPRGEGEGEGGKRGGDRDRDRDGKGGKGGKGGKRPPRPEVEASE
jgi:hypothetical protein